MVPDLNKEREAFMEVQGISELSSGLSDGMTVLTARNIARPLNHFIESGNPLPEYLSHVEPFAEKFLEWQTARSTKTAHVALWENLNARKDTRLYIDRKVWEAKTKSGHVVHPAARVLAVTADLHSKYRTTVHEAINHAAKHNTDIKALGKDLHDNLDEVVVARLQETTQMIMGTMLATLPQFQAELTAQLTHEVTNESR